MESLWMDVRSELIRLENLPVALLEAEGVDVDFLEEAVDMEVAVMTTEAVDMVDPETIMAAEIREAMGTVTLEALTETIMIIRWKGAPLDPGREFTSRLELKTRLALWYLSSFCLNEPAGVKRGKSGVRAVQKNI
ncbi:uncharacterized protein LOC120306640 isoform X2 [Crotalus tigris]|uniref:uncharacterized protein LOC120306640 isoform X2 n=1 Tax=Crotalus tigris TaxID=88082 RepID=UPI00192FB64A|nr:uncharacterized protein LOC120306640 isoform X2 [Crotalus tigris]